MGARILKTGSHIPDINGWTFATSSKAFMRTGTASMKVLTPFSIALAIWGAFASASTTACCPSESVTAFCTCSVWRSAFNRRRYSHDQRTNSIEELLYALRPWKLHIGCTPGFFHSIGILENVGIRDHSFSWRYVFRTRSVIG